MLEINTSLSKCIIFTVCCTTEYDAVQLLSARSESKDRKVQLNGGQLAILKPEIPFLTSSHDVTLHLQMLLSTTGIRGSYYKPYISWLLRMSVSQLVDTDSGVSKSRRAISHRLLVTYFYYTQQEDLDLEDLTVY